MNAAAEKYRDSVGRRQADRRRGGERRDGHGVRVPPWEEQRAQYLTRLLFWALGLAYFNLGGALHTRACVSLAAFNTVLLLYGGEIAFFMRHAARRLEVRWRWHVTMWVDMLAASFAILADPAVISPGFLAYLVVIIGNGMRYGLHLFAEAVIGSLTCALLVIGLRLIDYLDAVSVSAAFFLLLFVIIVLYSYSLTATIDKGRKQLETERDLDHLTGLLNRRALHERAERLQQRLSEWSRRENIDLSFSIGMGRFPDHGADLKTVIERVDQAMHRSKLERGHGGILQVGQEAPV